MGITVTADDIKPFYDGGVISGMAPEVADRITSILDRKYPDEESRNMSGWTDSEADEYIEDFEQRVLDAGAEAELGAYIDAVKAANKFAVDYAYSHGIISEEAHDMYLNQYENYVPLIDWEDDADREANESFRSAGGWNIELSREAKGRQTRAANVTAAIVYRGINTIVNGKENESRSALHRMILNAPGASALFFIEGQEAPQWAKDMKKEDLEKHSVSVYVDGRPTKMYFAGEAGRNLSYGLDRYFTFSQKVIGNSKGGKLAWKTLGDLNAFRSQILTTFDPAFNIRNLARDMGFAARQMFVSHGAKGMRLWAKNLTDSISDIYNYQFGLPVSPEFEAYLANGGRIGYSTMKTLDEVKRQHMRSMEKITSGKKDRTGSGAVAGMFEGIASSFESISRYAAFRAAKEMGMSDKHAAYVAHEAATDLSRHGNQTALSRTTLFFNASLEGANQVIRNYTSGGEVAARQGICTAISMALHVAAIKMIEQVARAMFSNAGGDDDDLKAMPTLMSRLPEYIKRGQLVWPLSVDKYGRVTGIKIDLPFQYRVNGYAAQRIVEAIQGDADWGDVYHDIINAYIAEYDPLAGSAPGERNNEDAFTLSPVELTPDAFKPVAEAIFNMNNYGRNVYTRYEMGSGKATRAAWSLAKPGTDKTAIAISKFLGGKDETKRKGIQIRPEVIEHIFDGYLGWIAQGVGHLDNNPRYEQAYDANGKPLVNQLTNEPILEHKGGFTEPEYQRYGQREPLVQRFVYNGTRDLGYSLLRDWEKESVEEKEAVAKATADDFRELMNVTNEQRKAIVNDAAVDCGYKSYESMARDVKKLEKSYRDNIRRAADPTLMAPMRRSADNGARRELEAIMEIHYRFAKAYYKRQKDNQ